ncbi:tRNA (adenosine(37)-N6)-dimethylallyltransferase MiaA [Schumannella sp. 10F1B-5-1]|uniref:tRNA (adenosine(37)-N6)-dimethylallyltransferase MiaA n=1 Tax=Schumannella sp. 10F1B-5-1 TaxID=2590780 RepID=UPI0011320862|nr:tRNA (adenosine(37)-N6)-dimethylallyltransferase MiaA [Schumannella sp. 10F1B-5-1]TPW70263.1 tRNA (adenosine(37)-N6)-dimethylallyltransferase MiaA [Schumannella sp. 10F1B-5-1]
MTSPASAESSPRAADGDPSPIVAVIGATGTGKSDLSLDLAERLAAQGVPTEIVNADAMQLYRGMDIGTAKLSTSERRGVPHHLLDVLDPRDEASVAAYQRDARAAIEDIRARGAQPILVGGSGLYVSAVLYDYDFPGTDAAIRGRLEAELDERGPGMLHRRLLEIDPESAREIGASNGRRLVRALEVIELTGRPFRTGQPGSESLWRPAVTIGLELDRSLLVERLDRRVERMWAAGLIDEVAALRPTGLGVTAARAIGYAQALAQLDGEVDAGTAIADAAALTRRYARRQVSWFRRYPDTHWIDALVPDRVEVALDRIRSAASPAAG